VAHIKDMSRACKALFRGWKPLLRWDLIAAGSRSYDPAPTGRSYDRTLMQRAMSQPGTMPSARTAREFTLSSKRVSVLACKTALSSGSSKYMNQMTLR